MPAPARGQIWTRVSDMSVWRVASVGDETVTLSGPGPARSVTTEAAEDLGDPLLWTFTWEPIDRDLALQGG